MKAVTSYAAQTSADLASSLPLASSSSKAAVTAALMNAAVMTPDSAQAGLESTQGVKEYTGVNHLRRRGVNKVQLISSRPLPHANPQRRWYISPRATLRWSPMMTAMMKSGRSNGRHPSRRLKQAMAGEEGRRPSTRAENSSWAQSPSTSPSSKKSSPRRR